MRTPFTRILVGWDGSTGAAKGLELALRLSACETGRVTAVAVVSSFTHVEDAAERAHATEQLRAPLREAFDGILAGIALVPGQRATLEFVIAPDVGQAFDTYTAAHPVELVVVGLHGREGLLHTKMGHVASHAVQISRCPVLVVPGAEHWVEEPAQESRLSSLFHPFRRSEPT